MVMQKRLDYGFIGYQVPFMPQAARSARRRGSFGSRVEDKQMCAFDLLASVAGELLLEKETTPTSTSTSTDKGQFAAVNNSVKKECPYDGRPFEEVTCDETIRDKSFFVSEILSSGHGHNDLRCKEDLHMLSEISLGVDSVITSVDCSERFDAEKLGECRIKNSLGSIANKVDVGSIYRKPDRCRLESEITQLVNGSGIDMCSLENKMARDGKPVLASSDNTTKVPLCGKQIPHSSFPASRDDVNLVSKDDEEKSLGCTHPYTSKKFFRPTPRIGDRRIKKILASRHWKVAPKSKYMARYNAAKDMKPFSRYKKEFYKHQRSERIYPFKKRKHFDCSSASNSDGRICLEFLSDSPDGKNNVEGSGSYLKMHGATGASSSVAGQNTSFQSRDSHVKLRIRSFRVPELFIEIPEAATVGSLKRTVMEAVTTILGGGLRVGVLLQGKKVGDDNKTLLQTGISQVNHLDALGFSLEPHSSQSPPPLCPRDTPLMLLGDVSQPLTRQPPSPGVIRNSIRSPSTELHVHSAPSPTNMSVEKSTMDCQVLVSVPAMSVEALAVVPVHRRSKRSETVQRRIRRPFSVAEVEGLVQAVEKLGTGRWRDVKLRAFNNAKYRTYVDLKDKWKTLVHTATISPQQRRGEPVPQELLDRVLTAHAYWSQTASAASTQTAARARDLPSPLKTMISTAFSSM